MAWAPFKELSAALVHESFMMVGVLQIHEIHCALLYSWHRILFLKQNYIQFCNLFRCPIMSTRQQVATTVGGLRKMKPARVLAKKCDSMNGALTDTEFHHSRNIDGGSAQMRASQLLGVQFKTCR